MQTRCFDCLTSIRLPSGDSLGLISKVLIHIHTARLIEEHQNLKMLKRVI